MSSTIVINKNHIVQNGLNNYFRFDFTGSNISIKNKEICLSSLQIYNSQFNINQGLYNNSSFQVLVPTGSTYQTVNINLPNGYFSYSDISNFITSELINIGGYLVDSQGNSIVYIQIRENPNLYSCEIILLATPTSVPANWSRPATGLYSTTGSGLPTASNTARIVILNNNFSEVVGFTPATYPSVIQTTDQLFLSNMTPQVNPVSSYIIRCNLVNNSFSSPPDILTSFTNQGTTIGDLINVQPPEYQWVSINDGVYTNISLTISDQNYNQVKFEDANILIILLIRERKNY